MPPVLTPITFVTGPLGEGKSYFANRIIQRFASAGKVVACNFDLIGNWWDTYYKLRPKRGFSAADTRVVERVDALGRTYRIREPYRLDDQASWAAECRSRVFRYDNASELYDYQLPGKGESRGLLVLDEGGLNLNSRLYRERQTRDKEKHENPIRELQWYINMRKRGWTCLILAHSQKHLDNQVRDMGGGVVIVRNFARVDLPIIGGGITTTPLFLAKYYRPDLKGDKPTGREIYKLDIRIAQHYKSQDEFEFMPQSKGLRPMWPYSHVVHSADNLEALGLLGDARADHATLERGRAAYARRHSASSLPALRRSRSGV